MYYQNGIPGQYLQLSYHPFKIGIIMKVLAQLYYSRAAVIKFTRCNQVSGMSNLVSSLDVFLGSIMDQETDNCDDCFIEMVIKLMLAGTRKSFYF